MPVVNNDNWVKVYPSPCDCCPACEESFRSLNGQISHCFYTYSATVNTKEAKAIISRHLTTIREASADLSREMGTHADLLMSRWKKCSQAKRENLLRAIAPNIAPNPWIRVDFSPSDAVPEYISNPKTRHQLLLPWLDVETLKTHPHTLFALLHYRLHHPPQAWAAFDVKQLDFGWTLGLFKVRFARMGVMVHGPRYGELTKWDSPAAHRGDILGFPRAELLFEAQAYLMTTLRDLVLQVLNGVDEGVSVRTSNWRELTSITNFRLTNDVELWSPYIFPAFSPAPILDLHCLTSLANARLGVARDHLRRLQHDPTYMRREMSLDIGKKVNTSQKQNCSSVSFVSHLISEVFTYVLWQWLEIECKKAEDLKQRFGDSIQAGQPLPRKYKRALGEIELILRFAIGKTLLSMEEDSTARDAMTNYQTTCTNMGLAPHISGKWKSDNPLGWCLAVMLFGYRGGDDLIDNALLLRYFQYHISIREKARVSEFVCRWVTDLSAFYEMLASVLLGRPKAEKTYVEEVMKTAYREEWLFTVNLESTKMNMGPIHVLAQSLLHEFFEVEPPRGPKNLKWLQRSRETRKVLENFWSSLHEILSKEFRSQGISKHEVQRMLGVIAETQSVDYQQVIAAEEAKILTEIEQQKVARETFSYLTKSHGGIRKTIVTAELRKEKIKTRPQESNETDVLVSKEATESQMKTLEPDHTPALVRTSKRALNAIRFMFPQTPKDANGGLQWTEFVHVMNDMGFVARNNGGSAVSFEADGQGRIVFHRPHPDSKIAPVMLQAMGARMNKLFGWKRENFVLDEA
ncbi:hypothetical protein F5Y12DRAFT_718039 [Xylaria sp. FL1777]|nr:hypothetical protein F5Y12DRAFT_718039 [Xylaria sp. FL1777]